jgi:hypothetical protein
MLGHGGTGLKPPDYLCVPLDAEEHAKLHQMGEKSYWESRRTNAVDMVCMTMLVYLAKNPSTQLVDALGRIVDL